MLKITNNTKEYMVKNKSFFSPLISHPPSLRQTLLTVSYVFFQRFFPCAHTNMHLCISVSLFTERVVGNANGGIFYLAVVVKIMLYVSTSLHPLNSCIALCCMMYEKQSLEKQFLEVSPP